MEPGARKSKTCFRCKSEFPLDSEHFFRSRDTSNGYHSWCKVCCRKANKISKAKINSTFSGRVSTFLTSCRNSSKRRGHKFTLTAKELLQMWETQQGRCVYSGLKLDLVSSKLTTVSVERVDNTVGYTAENTVLVCAAINRMKSDLKAEDFYNLCKHVTLWLSDSDLELCVRFSRYG